MPFSLSVLEILSYTLSFMFPLWPLLVLSCLHTRKNVVFTMLLMWGVMATIRAALLFAPRSPMSPFLIPEPLNTVLFLATGIVLLSLQIRSYYVKSLTLHRKMEGATDIPDLGSLSPAQFEELVVEVYRLHGHQAQRAGGQAEPGIDVLVNARDGAKWVIQCRQGQVEEPMLRDFYEMMQREKADSVAIITPGTFTRQARAWARGKPLHLYDGQQFTRALEKARTRKQGETHPHRTAPLSG